MNRTIHGTSLADVQEKARSVSNNLALNGKSRIARDILAYLVEHSDAQDTLDGIIQWWLPERELMYRLALVREAIGELVENGWVITRTRHNSRTYYQINEEKKSEIEAFLKQQSD
jgi:hypothetical protein